MFSRAQKPLCRYLDRVACIHLEVLSICQKSAALSQRRQLIWR